LTAGLWRGFDISSVVISNSRYRCSVRLSLRQLMQNVRALRGDFMTDTGGGVGHPRLFVLDRY